MPSCLVKLRRACQRHRQNKAPESQFHRAPPWHGTHLQSSSGSFTDARPRHARTHSSRCSSVQMSGMQRVVRHVHMHDDMPRSVDCGQHPKCINDLPHLQSSSGSSMEALPVHARTHSSLSTRAPSCRDASPRTIAPARLEGGSASRICTANSEVMDCLLRGPGLFTIINNACSPADVVFHATPRWARKQLGWRTA